MDNGQFWLDITIPANTTATIYIPAKEGAEISEGNKPVNSQTNITPGKQETGYKVLEVGSGVYHFSTH
jgi:alpha-L-rhamnosidase